MSEALRTLTEREKETLRLLVAGHDAKSIARSLGLSVHTVNERLRDARRKLRVSSSREAARLLIEAEGEFPKPLGDKGFGVVITTDDDETSSHTDQAPCEGRPASRLNRQGSPMSRLVPARKAPLRFWLRIGFVASILWIVLATFFHSVTFRHEMVSDYMRHLKACQLSANSFAKPCLIHAEHQLDVSRANALPMAIAVTLLQLAVLWLVGSVMVIGARWANHARRLTGGAA
ncbi:helix-turn-helix transcriptional regulator [Sphingomonas sp. GC_Shp_3]|uniref:response regulator transcription factor n=1 Tax=Sphingomonas sp. GC_Shp_3 TaxID=2937383 RepID=UPI00226A2886|nr:helix-turn-helix transcriptional regulator [Sphingomonas sp. GC_Shp_3]